MKGFSKWLWYVAAAACLGVVLFYSQRRSGESFPIYGLVPRGAFSDASGAPFSTDSLKDKVVAYALFFTRCPGQCPLLIEKMKASLKSVVDEGKLEIVLLSVDPTHDTPSVIKAYSEKKQIPERWHVLTGPRADVDYFVKQGLRLSAEPAPGVDIVSHSFRIVLVDRLQQIRGYYDGLSEGELSRLVEDAGRL